jgi:ubiquinone biosynthesis protein UbiJ
MTEEETVAIPRKVVAYIIDELEKIKRELKRR